MQTFFRGAIRIAIWAIVIAAILSGMRAAAGYAVRYPDQPPAVWLDPAAATRFALVRDGLTWAAGAAAAVAGVTVALIVGGAVALILGWFFFPVLHPQNRSRADWVRTLLMLPCVAAFTLWFRDMPALEAARTQAKEWASGTGVEDTSWADWTVAAAAAFGAAITVYMLVMSALAIWDTTMAAIVLLARLVDRASATGSTGVVRLRQQLFPSSRPADPAGEKADRSVAPALMGAPVVLLVAGALFFVRDGGPDWTGIGLVAVGTGVAIATLRAINAAHEPARRTALLPTAAILVLIGVLLFDHLGPRHDDDAVLPPPEWAWAATIRQAIRDCCLGIGLTLILATVLTRRLAAGTAAGARYRLWATLAGYFGAKAGLIAVGIGVSALTPPLALSNPDGRLKDVFGAAPAADVFRVWAGDYAFMAWSGEVLQAEEFLYARWKERAPLDRKQRGVFESAAREYHKYYDQRFSPLVLTQIVLGWHYGMTLLCYLLFGFALYAFRYPAPTDSRYRDADAFLDDRRKTATIDRIREAANAIVTLGFVGTLLGLSQAIFFLSAADPLGELLGRSSVSSRLAGSLGLGFFTTFLSMVLKLALNFRFAQLAGEHSGYQKQLQVLADQG